jgi:hypothetical protein
MHSEVWMVNITSKWLWEKSVQPDFLSFLFSYVFICIVLLFPTYLLFLLFSPFTDFTYHWRPTKTVSPLLHFWLTISFLFEFLTGLGAVQLNFGHNIYLLLVFSPQLDYPDIFPEGINISVIGQFHSEVPWVLQSQ